MFLQSSLLEEADSLLEEINSTVLYEGKVSGFLSNIGRKVKDFIQRIIDRIVGLITKAKKAHKGLKILAKADKAVSVVVQSSKDVLKYLQEIRAKAVDAFSEYKQAFAKIASSKIEEWKAIAARAWRVLKEKIESALSYLASKFKSIRQEKKEGKPASIMAERDIILDKAKQVAEEAKVMSDKINDGINSTDSERVRDIYTTQMSFIVKAGKMASEIIEQEEANMMKIASAQNAI